MTMEECLLKPNSLISMVLLLGSACATLMSSSITLQYDNHTTLRSNSDHKIINVTCDHGYVTENMTSEALWSCHMCDVLKANLTDMACKRKKRNKHCIHK